MTQQKMITTRAGLMRLLIIIGVAAVLLVVNFSFPIANWWGDHVRIRGRPDTGEWDVHIVLWFATTSIVGGLVRPHSHSRLMAVLVSMLMLSALLEWAQPYIALRTFQWSDLVGNLVGISLAGAFLAWHLIIRPRHVRPAG